MRQFFFSFFLGRGVYRWVVGFVLGTCDGKKVVGDSAVVGWKGRRIDDVEVSVGGEVYCAMG